MLKRIYTLGPATLRLFRLPRDKYPRRANRLHGCQTSLVCSAGDKHCMHNVVDVYVRSQMIF